MYAYLNGSLAEVEAQNIVVEVGGIGYNVQISAGKQELLPPLGEAVKVYTYTCVREDAFLLYGFLTKQELEMFRKLITVNSVGPKYALNILSELSVEDVIFAIVGGDVKVLTKASGVGTKMAQKIILELKNKVDAEEIILPGADSAAKGSAAETDPENISEAIQALVALGYARQDAKQAVLSASKDQPEADSEALLKGALRYLL